MPFQVSSIMIFKTAAVPASPALVDVPQDLIAGCPVSFVLEAVALGDLTGHTLLWEQLSGSTVSWDTPIDQLIVAYDPIVNDDKVFRFWVDKGTPQETYKDVEVFSSPYGKGVITGDSIRSVVIHDRKFTHFPSNSSTTMYVTHPPVFVVEKLNTVSSPLGEIVVNETNFDIYIPLTTVFNFDVSLRNRNTGNTIFPDDSSKYLYSFFDISDPIQYIVEFLDNNRNIIFEVDLRDNPSGKQKHDANIYDISDSSKSLSEFVERSTGEFFPSFQLHGTIMTKETIGENVSTSINVSKVSEFFSLIIDPTNYTLSGTEENANVGLYSTQGPPYAYTPDPDWTVFGILANDPTDQIQSTINTPEQTIVTRTLYNVIFVGSS